MENISSGALNDKQGETFLIEAIVQNPLAPARHKAEVEAWHRGNPDAILRLEQSAARDEPEVFDRFVFQGTARWIPRLEGYIKSGKPIMVIVGAAHLGGSRGLLALLRGRGYQVEQL